MIDQLIKLIKKTGAPICVGLDTQLDFVPKSITDRAFKQYGMTLEGASEAIWEFNRAIVDAVADLVPSVKIQIAMYEMYGIPGLRVYRKTIDYCRSRGLVVIGDVKRGDIGSTSAAYAAAHLGKVIVGEQELEIFNEDFCTVNPYLGIDGISPFLNECAIRDKGIFILVKTSNPSGGEFQDCLVLDTAARGTSKRKDTGQNNSDMAAAEDSIVRPLYEIVAEKVFTWGNHQDLIGESGYSEVGAVIGATYPETGMKLRKIMPWNFFLVPGYGAQGAQGRDLSAFFNKDGLGAIVNSSRGIIAAYKRHPFTEKYGQDGFADAAREAVKDMKKDIAQALDIGKSQ